MSYCECDYDDGDMPEFYNEAVVKARKQHKCDECHGPVFKGEEHKRRTGKWNGEVQTYRECPPCMEMRQWAKISVPCFCTQMNLGELHDKIEEMVDDVRHDVPGFFFEYGRRMVKLRQRKRRALN